MVRNMYKERVKSSINPFLLLVIWFVLTYVFTILWGIAQIVFEFESLITMQLICLAETVWVGWFLITRVLTEFEYEIFENKLTITKILSKRSSVVCIIGLDNVKCVTKEKKKCNQFSDGRIKSFVRPGQKEKRYYVVYKSDESMKAVKICASKKLINHIK